MTAILQGIGWFLLKIYEFFESAHIPAAYALSLVVFTIIVKVVLFYFSYKGKQSMIKMGALQNKQKQLEQQYANNKQKYQEELQKLYEREKINPMGGCLWSLLPLPILMGLYYIIRRPMLYMMGIPNDAIQTAIDAVTNAGYTFSGNTYYYELKLSSLLGDADVLSIVKNAIPEYANKLHAINFNFFGIDLSQTPKLMFWNSYEELGVWCAVGLFLIPLFVTALNFWYTRFSMKTNQALTAPEEDKKKKKEKDGEEKKSSSERSNQMMMWLMPLMYLWFGYSMPAGMCVYMAVNALCTVGQDAICVKIMRKSFLEMQEQQRLRDEKERAELAAKKEALAERRRLQEEANKAGKGKKKGKKTAKPAAKAVNKNGRIGIRTYALGRDYDPDRYGGVTAYRDPQEIIDEQAVEESYKKKRRRRADAVEQALQQAEEAGDLEAVERLEEEQAALEEAEQEAEEAAAVDAGEAPSDSAPLSEQVFDQIFEETAEPSGEEPEKGPSEEA